MSNPFDHFDRIYCFHLPQETERKEIVTKEFENMGFADRVEFIHVTPPPKNFTMSNMRRNSRTEFGVNLTQFKAIVHAAIDGAQTPLFFEDDVTFRPDTHELLSAALSELPEDWDLMYFGGHPRGPLDPYRAKPYSKTLMEIGRFSFADSYTLSRNALLRFVDEWFERISREKAMYDLILGDFAAKCKTYCIYPQPVVQRVVRSGVSGKVEDKRPLIARAWKNHLET